MNIFVIGQLTLHWGRMEFGNIGNYYIVEPFFLELHRVFPDAEIYTTFQMSDEFLKRVDVRSVPMEEYYGWNENDLPVAYKELAIASVYSSTGELIEKTPYIQHVLEADLVIDFSGDIWGQNADFVGPNRFLVGLLKDRTAQLLGKPTAMLAGSPGPFNRDATLEFAKEVFKNFDIVTNREDVSLGVLKDFGFDVSKVRSLACPAFIFAPANQDSVMKYVAGTPLQEKKKPTVCFMLCGWNMLHGPFSREDWKDEEFDIFVRVVHDFIKRYDVNMCFMSHSNGFNLPPQFKMIHGRDYPMVKQMYEILLKTDVKDSVYLFSGIYTAKETKAIVANFDMVISGRVHGAIAALSQSVPTVIIDYGHEPKAHKLCGFARVAGMEEYIADPASYDDLYCKVVKCWENRVAVKSFLKDRNMDIAKMVSENFNLLKTIL